MRKSLNSFDWIIRGVRTVKVPANKEEDDGPSTGAAGLETTAATKALASNHDNSLACHQEEEAPHSKPGGNVGIVDAVVIVLLLVWNHLRLPSQPPIRDTQYHNSPKQCVEKE